jgi:hypothetical protein
VNFLLIKRTGGTGPDGNAPKGLLDKIVIRAKIPPKVTASRNNMHIEKEQAIETGKEIHNCFGAGFFFFVFKRPGGMFEQPF